MDTNHQQRKFRFRRFAVADDQCSMKVGTDAVLLAAWAVLDGAQSVLDIGTGSGVIALIAAQRTDASCTIHGVEIQERDSIQAMTNVGASPWADRVKIFRSAIQDYVADRQYDVILCNPPYFVNSLKPTTEGRTNARHAVTLDHPALSDAVGRLLAPAGRASFIMPPVEAAGFIQAMNDGGMHLTHRCEFRTRTGKKVERVLLTFSRLPGVNPQDAGENSTGPTESGLILYGSGEDWTEEYAALTAPFYLPRG